MAAYKNQEWWTSADPHIKAVIDSMFGGHGFVEMRYVDQGKMAQEPSLGNLRPDIDDLINGEAVSLRSGLSG